MKISCSPKPKNRIQDKLLVDLERFANVGGRIQNPSNEYAVEVLVLACIDLHVGVNMGSGGCPHLRDEPSWLACFGG